MSYPEPNELKEFSTEPIIFHDIQGNELELLDSHKIRVGYENVEYVFHPTYILEEVENSQEERERYEYPNWPIPAEELFSDMMNVSILEDYICGTVLSDGYYEVYWVLEKVTFENPNLYN